MRILYLDLDTLRPDHLGCYGYHRDTSPNLDRVAAEGVRFTNYYTSDAPCLPSRTAMMSGQFGIHNGCVNHGGQCADIRPDGEDRQFRDRLDKKSLPGMLRGKGYRTTLISPFGERHSAYHFYAGFNEMHNTGSGGMESAEEVSPTVMKWLDDNASDDNWYLHINYWDAHTPYRAPEEFGNPFKDEPIADWLTEEVLEEHKKMVGPHKALEINMYNDGTWPEYPRHLGALHTMDDLRQHIDGYDCGIRYMDGHVGQILDKLEAAGVLDDTAIIISADHGENQGELGIYGEHATADHANCRIPMIVRWPDGRKNVADEGLHYNVDWLPTLCELVDGNKADFWDGESYASSITSDKDNGREQLVISQCAHTLQRGVRFGPWMYIRTIHDGYHLFPHEMLFNIEEDPHEQVNLVDTKPEIAREGAWRMMNWYEDMMKTQPGGYDTDPMWTIYHEGGPYHAKGHLGHYIEFLKKTGREYAIEELKARHPYENVE